MFHMLWACVVNSKQIQVAHTRVQLRISWSTWEGLKFFLVYGGESELVVEGYTYEIFQIDKDDFQSQSSFIFCLNEGVVSWKSSKQSIVSDSTIEDGYIDATDVEK